MLKLFFTNDQVTPVDVQIEALAAKMEEVGVLDDSYPTLVEHMVKLEELKAKSRKPPISRDTVAIIVGGIIQTLIIVIYEEKHVLSSKGFTQILRPKSNVHTQ